MMKKILIILALFALAVPSWAVKDLDINTNATDSTFNFLRSTTCSTRVAWAESIKANGPLYLWSKADSIIALEKVIVRQDSGFIGNVTATDSVKAVTVVKGNVGVFDSIGINHIRMRVGSVSCTTVSPMSTTQLTEFIITPTNVSFVGGTGFGAPLVTAPADSFYYTGSATRDTIWTRTLDFIPIKIDGAPVVIDSFYVHGTKLNATDTIHAYIVRIDSVGFTFIDSTKAMTSAGNFTTKINTAAITLTRSIQLRLILINAAVSTNEKIYRIRILYHRML